MRLEIRFTASAAVFLCVLAGCATGPRRAPDLALVKAMDALENQNKVLKEQSIVRQAPKLQPKSVEIKAPVEVAFNDEHSLYQAALDAYWKKDSAQLKRVAGIFIKTFPNSTFADNVLYLKGNLDFSKDDIRSAMESLNQLVEDYPEANKRVSADLLRAVIFTRLNLNEQAQEIFQRLVRQ